MVQNHRFRPVACSAGAVERHTFVERGPMPNVLIAIPARYHSTRLPGKPLRKINGIPMIERVAAIAAAVCRRNESCRSVVATDHPDIVAFCQSRDIPVLMTSEACTSGTERCWEAARQQQTRPDFIVNLQGDNPLCPPHIIQSLIDAWRSSPPADVYTPAVHLGWDDYERMLAAKKVTPYSGTTVAIAKNGNAMFFSKNIIPAIRDLEKAKAMFGDKSPVWRHIGLYAYTAETLERYFQLDSPYEKSCVEGLEQMRFLYNGMTVRVVEADYRGRRTTSGVDSEEDVVAVEEILNEFGEFRDDEGEGGQKPALRRLVIIRHGNTFRADETPRRVGARTDLPLVEEERAGRAAKILDDHGYRADRICAAPLQRTMQTAAIVARETGYGGAIVPVTEFVEIDYGPDENRTEEEVIERLGRAVLGTTGEVSDTDAIVTAGKDAVARWDRDGSVPEGWCVDAEAIRRSWSRFASAIRPSETVVLVSSNGIIRFAPCLLSEGEASFRSHSSIKVATGGVSVFEDDGSGWRCVLWNARERTGIRPGGPVSESPCA